MCCGEGWTHRQAPSSEDTQLPAPERKQTRRHGEGPGFQAWATRTQATNRAPPERCRERPLSRDLRSVARLRAALGPLHRSEVEPSHEGVLARIREGTASRRKQLSGKVGCAQQQGQRPSKGRRTGEKGPGAAAVRGRGEWRLCSPEHRRGGQDSSESLEEEGGLGTP